MITQITPHYARAQFLLRLFQIFNVENFEKDKSIEAVSIMHHVSRESEWDYSFAGFGPKKIHFTETKTKGIEIQIMVIKILHKKRWLTKFLE